MIYPDAVWVPGPAELVGYNGVTTASKTGLVNHSAEGNFVAGNRPVDIMRARRVSWHFSVYKSGLVEQHYELDAICYHAGNALANKYLVGSEHEGTDALTEQQLSASIKLTGWVCEQLGVQRKRRVSLWEHNEVWDWVVPNSGHTACPSGRIPWSKYVEESMFTPEEEVAIRGLLIWREQVVPVIDGIITSIAEIEEELIGNDDTADKLEELLLKLRSI